MFVLYSESCSEEGSHGQRQSDITTPPKADLFAEGDDAGVSRFVGSFAGCGSRQLYIGQGFEGEPYNDLTIFQKLIPPCVSNDVFIVGK